MSAHQERVGWAERAESLAADWLTSAEEQVLDDSEACGVLARQWGEFCGLLRKLTLAANDQEKRADDLQRAYDAIAEQLSYRDQTIARLGSSPALVVSGLPEDGQGENK